MSRAPFHARHIRLLPSSLNAVDAELMAQLETAHQAIIELQLERDALREALEHIKRYAGSTLEGGSL